MSKYKLIKIYPGSPKLGTIVEVDKDGWCCTSCNLNPQDYPEFWEKVVEKDYEILSFKSNFYTFVLDDDGYYSYNKNRERLSLSNLEKNPLYTIHSVKRLSDGEVFTVGDKCDDGIVQGFNIIDDKMYIDF